jgi:hypothetical protein
METWTVTREVSESLNRIKRDYKSGKLPADDWLEFRVKLSAERKSASAKLVRLREQERGVAERREARDVEEDVLRRLTELFTTVDASAVTPRREPPRGEPSRAAT